MTPARARIVVVGLLVVAAPMVALAGMLRPAWGRRAAAAAARLGARLTGVRVNVVGPRPAAGPALVVANHSSPLDVVVLAIAEPDLRFVMASDLLPGAARAVVERVLGMASVDRRDPARGLGDLRRLATRFGAGRYAIFPEGAIAPAGGRLAFKTGPFDLALRAEVPLVPVAIHGTSACLAPRGRLLVRPGVITVEYLDPVPTAGLGVRDRRTLRDRTEAALLGALADADEGGPVPGRGVLPEVRGRGRVGSPPVQEDRN